jgi:hypothetical protein
MGKAYNCFSVPASSQTNVGGVSFLLLHVAEIKPGNGGAGEKISHGENEENKFRMSLDKIDQSK